MPPKKKQTNETTVVTSIRIDRDLHDKIEELAEREERSFNWKLNNILRQFFEIGESKDKSPQDVRE